MKSSRYAWLACALMMLVVGIAGWRVSSDSTKLPVVARTSPADHRSPTTDASTLQGSEAAVPAPNRDQPEDALPNKLHKIVKQLRASGNAHEKLWADAIVLGWTDFAASCELLAKAFPDDFDEKRQTLLWLIGSEDLQKGFAGLELIDSAQSRRSVVALLSSEWSRKDVASLIDFAEHLEGETRDLALREAIEPLVAKGKLGEAENAMRKMTSSDTRRHVLRTIANAHAKEDPHDALLWAETLENPDEKSEAAWCAVSEGTRRWGPDELLELAETSTDTRVKAVCISAVASNLAKQDLQSGLTWAETLPADLQGVAKRRIAKQLAETDADRATSIALTIPGPEQVLDEIQRQLMRKGPEPVLAWINTLPEEYQTREANGLVREWYRIDPDKAAAWVSQLASGNVRDRALAALADSMRNESVTSAREIASQISAPRLREAILDTLR